MPSMKLDGYAIEHNLSISLLKAARKEIEASRISTKSHVNVLKASIASKNVKGQTAAANWLLYNRCSRLSFAISANQSLPPERRQPLEACFEIAKTLDFSQPLQGLVPVSLKPKASGGYRVLHDPPLVQRAAQNIVECVIKHHFRPRNFQHFYCGSSRAIARMIKAIEGGFRFVARLDITKFYPSFEFKKLVHKLPLPKEVVEYVVVGRHLNVRLQKGGPLPTSPGYPSLEDIIAQARLGLPMGSCCSPIVGSFIVSFLSWSDMKGVVLVNFADDFLLLAKTPELLVTAIERLTSSVEKLPGGTFKLNLKQNGPASAGFGFLGHEIQMASSIIEIVPSETNQYRATNHLHLFQERFDSAIKSGNVDKAAQILGERRTYVRSWRNAFRHCTDLEEWDAFFGLWWEDSLKMVGLTEDQLPRAQYAAHKVKVYEDE